MGDTLTSMRKLVVGGIVGGVLGAVLGALGRGKVGAWGRKRLVLWAIGQAIGVPRGEDGTRFGAPAAGNDSGGGPNGSGTVNSELRLAQEAVELALKLYRETVLPQPNVVNTPAVPSEKQYDPSWDAPPWEQWGEGDVKDPNEDAFPDLGGEEGRIAAVPTLNGVNIGGVGVRMPDMSGEGLDLGGLGVNMDSAE